MPHNLREIFNNHKNQTECNNYYCTTCGGISSKVRHLTSESRIIELLGDLESLSLNDRDFRQIKQNGFPKDKQCSDYILFLREVIDKLGYEKRRSIINRWSESQNLTTFIIDGIGFYLITDDCTDIWIPLMKELSSSVPSIKETLNLRFSELS